MARDLEIDDEGILVEGSSRGRKPSISPSGGRFESVPANSFLSVMDWRSDDAKAQEMLVSIGLEPESFDPAFFFVNPDGAPSRLAVDSPVIAPTPTWPFARVTFGVENFVQEAFLDFVPDQSLVVSAAFIRVQALNISKTLPVQPNRFGASVVPASSGRNPTGRFTVRGQATFGLLRTFQIAPCCKTLRIVRFAEFLNPANGNMELLFTKSAYKVLIPPTELERVIQIPAGDTAFTMTMQLAASTELFFVMFDVST